MMYTWEDFERNNKNVTKNFEALSRAYFKLRYTNSIDTPLPQQANNPGIETEPLLVDDIKIGFQAKYFTNNIDYSDIKDSLEKTLLYYKEKIDKVIIYSNKDIQLNTKSLSNIITKMKKSNVEVEAFCNNSLLDAINMDNKYTCLKSAFFNYANYDSDWYEEKLNKSIKNLGTRYIKNFNVEDNNFEELFDIFYKNEEGKTSIRNKIKEAVLYIDNRFYGRIEVTKDLRKLLVTLYYESKDNIDILFDSFGEISAYIKTIDEEIKNKREKNEDYSSLIHLKYALENLNFLNNNYRLYNCKLLIIEGNAGTGKSHLLAHEAEKNKESNNILLLGHTLIDDSSPEDQIKNYLELDCTFLTFLRNLNTNNSRDNNISVIYFDAINECYNKKAWKQYLKDILFEIQKLKYIKLVCTIRSTYFENVFDDDFLNSLDDSEWHRVIHHGFGSNTLYACNKFFEYYNIPFNPLCAIDQDFSNPLFLRIYCESLLRNGNINEHDIFSVYDSFIEKEEKEFKKRYEIDDGRHLSKIIFDECINMYLETKQTSFDKQSLLEFARQNNINQYIIRDLEKANIFFSYLSSNKEYLVFNFELFFEYNVSKRIIETTTSFEELLHYCNNTLLSNVNGFLVYSNAVGILSTLSILAKKQYGKELLFKLNLSGLNNYSIKNIIDEYFKLYTRRCDSDIDAAFIKKCVKKGLINNYIFFNMCLDLFVRECDLNIHYLNKLLSSYDLTKRDYFWTTFINDSFTDGNNVNRLVSLFYENDMLLVEKKKEVTLLFSWFLTANNRLLVSVNSLDVYN